MAYNGFTFPWAGRIFVIAPECMGYRSMSTMIVLAIALIILKRPGLLKSFVIVGSAGVLSIIGNLCRIGFLLLSASIFPDQWFSPIHDSAGYVVIIIEAVILGNICDWLVHRNKDKERVCTKS